MMQRVPIRTNWCTALSPPMIAPSSTVTWPAKVAAFAMIIRSPMWQSCAMWQYAITMLLFPRRVTPPPSAVPRFTVANSRTMLLSPISTQVSSPRNFRSCGSAADGGERVRSGSPSPSGRGTR